MFVRRATPPALLTAFAIAALVTVPVLAAQRESRGVCNVNTPAPLELTLQDVDGKQVPLTKFRGKILLLNFWATWCVPCKIEIPDFIDLYSRYGGKGVEIVGIDVEEPASTVKPYAAMMKINYPILLTGERHDIATAFGVDQGLPTTVVVNRDGTICRRRVGLTRKDTFELILKVLL
jgi:thiol-disulfide isomerase/thioredoxin